MLLKVFQKFQNALVLQVCAFFQTEYEVLSPTDISKKVSILHKHLFCGWESVKNDGEKWWGGRDFSERKV